MLNAGEKFGRYKIQKLLGTGGVGEVHLAEDTDLERLVALKVLSSAVSENSEQVQRFTLEAKAASALNHPNIMTIYEAGEVAGLRYIASEFVGGKTLSEIIRNEKLDLKPTLDIAIQVVSALVAAHEAGIIHRDIKPGNIMLRKDNLVKILDFGLAKLVEQEDQSKPITVTGAVMGTPYYMSPEQADGKAADDRTDLWSFGVVFYEMLTGKKAFPGSKISEVLTSLILKEPESMDDIRHLFPAGVYELVEKLLRKDREKRFQNAAEVLYALKNLKKRLDLQKELKALDLKSLKPIPSEILDIPNNLSENSPELVGRQKEITEICGLLRNGEVRLLTLLGIGGTGKTTLAKAVAHRLLPEFTGGVFFIELASVREPDLVVSAIAQALGIKEMGSRSILNGIGNFLKDKKMLLIFDNFEQVMDAAEFVSEILNFGSELRIIVTSRELLQLSSEQTYDVQPLNLPSKISQHKAEELAENESVKLFIQRAKIAKSGFNPNVEELQTVAEICVRLEGLPLAIEFAAARCRILSPAMILKKLDHRLSLLRGGAHDAPKRQQTMNGAIEWSYNLLEEDEKKIFRRLAVFSGGFTFEAVEAVVNLEKDEYSLDILDGIPSLLDKSLIFSNENTSGEPRFQMLEIVREYAFEVLRADGESIEAQKNHAAYFLKLGEKAESQLRGERSSEWLNVLEVEHDNFRAALGWLLENDVEKGINLISAISFFWLFRSYLSEGIDWIKKALGKGLSIPGETRFKLLNSLGWLTLRRGRYKKARKLFEEVLVLSKSSGDLKKIASASRGLANALQHMGDLEAAWKLSKEEWAISRKLNDKKLISDSLNSLGNLALMNNDIESARHYFDECLKVSKNLNSKYLINSCLINLGTVSFCQGNFAEAESFYRDSLKTALDLADKVVISYSLDGLAAISVEKDEIEKAAKLAGVAEMCRSSISAELEMIERKFRDNYLEKIRARLEENRFEKIYESGLRMDLNEAVEIF